MSESINRIMEAVYRVAGAPRTKIAVSLEERDS